MIRSKKQYWKSDLSGDHKGLFSKPMRSGNNNRFHNELNQLNMVQEWDKEVFGWKNNLKHNTNYNRCQENY
jgi:hypothetical protein